MKRITHNPKTSWLGAIIILASVASVFVIPGMNWTGASVGITAGTVFLFSKDKK